MREEFTMAGEPMPEYLTNDDSWESFLQAMPSIATKRRRAAGTEEA